jgi:hypothetical protein
MATKEAIFIERVTNWAAITCLFRLEPPLNNKKYIVVAAANAIDRYEMIIYSREPNENHNEYVYNFIKGEYKVFSSLPEFRKAIESIGYTMIGGPERKAKQRYPR